MVPNRNFAGDLFVADRFCVSTEQAFITCSWGVWNVGFVLICYGAADAVGSVVSGSLVRQLGRVPIFLFGAVVNAALVVTLLFWRPDPSQAAVFYVIAALWGVCDAIWQTQINGNPVSSSLLCCPTGWHVLESLLFLLPYHLGCHSSVFPLVKD